MQELLGKEAIGCSNKSVNAKIDYKNCDFSFATQMIQEKEGTVVGIPAEVDGNKEVLGTAIRGDHRVTVLVDAEDEDESEEDVDVCDQRPCRVCRLRCSAFVFITCGIILLVSIIVNSEPRRNEPPVMSQGVVIGSLFLLSVSSIVCVLSASRRAYETRTRR